MLQPPAYVIAVLKRGWGTTGVAAAGARRRAASRGRGRGAGARPVRPAAPRAARNAGFAAIDALVGLMILTVTIVLSLNALTVARDLTESANEARRAGSLLSFLVESAPGTPGAADGRAAAFDWRVRTEPTGVGVGGAIRCLRKAEVTARASHRLYAMSAMTICRTRTVGA